MSPAQGCDAPPVPQGPVWALGCSIAASVQTLAPQGPASRPRAVTPTGLVVAAGSLWTALLGSDTPSGQSAVSSHRASEWCWEGVGSGRTVAASTSAHDSHHTG